MSAEAVRSLLHAVAEVVIQEKAVEAVQVEAEVSFASSVHDEDVREATPPPSVETETKPSLIDTARRTLSEARSTLCQSAQGRSTSAIAWSLKFADSFKLGGSTSVVTTVVSQLEKEAEESKSETAACLAKRIAQTAIRHFDAASATATASLSGAALAPAVESITRRTRRLAALSRTSLPYFTPNCVAPTALHELGNLCTRLVTDESFSVDAFVDQTCMVQRWHPLRVLEVFFEVCTDLYAGKQAPLTIRDGIGAELVAVLAGGSRAVRDSLLTQMLTHKFAVLRSDIAPALALKTSMGALPTPGTALNAREVANAAVHALHRRLLTLAVCVKQGCLTTAMAWHLFATAFPHVDVSSAWFAAATRYTQEHEAHFTGVKTEIILEAAQAAAATETTQYQVIGENFALLSYGAVRPTWGILFATSSTTVGKLNPVSFAAALLKVDAFTECFDFIQALKFGPADSDDSEALLSTPYHGIDLCLCPNAATIWGSLSTIFVDRLVHVLTSTKRSVDEAKDLWQRKLVSFLGTFFDVWSTSPALTHAVASFLLKHAKAALQDAANHNVADWIALVHDALLNFLFPAIQLQPPSPAVNIALAQLIGVLPLDAQRHVVLCAESAFSGDTVGVDGSLLRVESLRHRALLNHCLNRVSSAEPRRFAGILATVLYANPLLVASKLITKAVGYSDARLLLTNAQLIREAPSLFFVVFPILALERAKQFAAKEDATSVTRVTAIGTFLALVWRHNWSSVNHDYVLKFTLSALQDHSRSGLIFACGILRCTFDHLLHQKLDHTEHRSTTQIAALAAGPLGLWYAGGPAETFKARWITTVFTPKLLRKNEKALSDAMRGGRLNVATLQELLRVHSEVFERYRDLPGIIEDVLSTAFSDMDFASDLALLIFANSVAHVSPSRRSSELSFSKLRQVAVPTFALLFSNERQLWREGAFASGSAPTLLLGDNFGKVAQSLGFELDGTSLSDASKQLLTMFWGFDLPDIADATTIASVYQAADQGLRELTEHGRQEVTRKLVLDGKTSASDPAVISSRLKRDLDDDTSALKAEASELTVRLETTARITSSMTFSDASSLMSASCFVQATMLRRARASLAHAKYSVQFLHRLSLSHVGIRPWAIDVLYTFVTAVLTLFVSLSGAEAARLGFAVREALILARTLCEEEASAERAALEGLPAFVFLPISKRPVLAEGYLAQAVSELLASSHVPPFVVRNVFQLLERTKGIFPSMRTSSFVVAAAMRQHCVHTSPHYASASSLSHSLMQQHDTLRKKLLAQAQRSPYGPQSASFFDHDLLRDGILESTLHAFVREAVERETAFTTLAAVQAQAPSVATPVEVNPDDVQDAAAVLSPPAEETVTPLPDNDAAAAEESTTTPMDGVVASPTEEVGDRAKSDHGSERADNSDDDDGDAHQPLGGEGAEAEQSSDEGSEESDDEEEEDDDDGQSQDSRRGLRSRSQSQERALATAAKSHRAENEQGDDHNGGPQS